MTRTTPALATLDRIALADLPQFSDYCTDSDGRPCVIANTYHCADCNVSWGDHWSCGCDDECPVCGSALGPEASCIDPALAAPDNALWTLLPEVEHEIAKPHFDSKIGLTVSRLDISRLTDGKIDTLILDLRAQTSKDWAKLGRDTERKHLITKTIASAILQAGVPAP